MKSETIKQLSQKLQKCQDNLVASEQEFYTNDIDKVSKIADLNGEINALNSVMVEVNKSDNFDDTIHITIMNNEAKSKQCRAMRSELAENVDMEKIGNIEQLNTLNGIIRGYLESNLILTDLSMSRTKNLLNLK